MFKFSLSLFTARLCIVALLSNLIFLPQVHAGGIGETISSKIGDRVRAALVKSGCKKLRGKLKNEVKGEAGLTKNREYENGVTGEVGCEALNLATNDEDLKTNLMNIVLMLSMVVSLINTKCGKTEHGNTYLPKSYTAGITHWIHKLAALIYIYANIQNTKKAFEIYADLEDIASSGYIEQSELLSLQKSAMEEQKASYEDKKGLLEIASMALGAVAAVETGMVAAMISMGSWTATEEGEQCVATQEAVASCKVPGQAGAKTEAAKLSMIQVMKQNCIDRYKTINWAGSLIKTAREKAVSMAVQHVSSAVTSSVAGSGKAAEIGVGAVTNVASQKATGYLNSEIADAINNVAGEGTQGTDDNQINLLNEVEDLKSGKCVTDAVNQKLDDWAAEGAAAAYVATTAGTTAYPAAAAANCSVQVKGAADKCLCAQRNTDGIKRAFAVYKRNLELKEIEGYEKEEDRTADKKTKIYTVPGVTTEEEVCAVDKINWGIRHDLNCLPLTSDGDTNAVDSAETTSFSNGKMTPEKAFRMLNDEMNKLKKLDPYKISSLLNQKHNMQLVDYLSDGEMTEEYLALSVEDKEEVNSALGFLGQAILKLQDTFIDSAQAETVQFTNSDQLMKELGLNAIGMVLVASLFDDVSQFIVDFHKTPIRRAVLFLTTYSMASSNVTQTDETIANIDEDIEKIDEMLKDFESETSYNLWYQLQDFLNPISTAHAAPKYWPKKERPRVCLQGSTIDTNCECLQGKGKCGYPLRFETKNELFSNKSFMQLTQSQVSFVKAAANGKVSDRVIASHKKNLQAASRNMDPIVANRNLGMISKALGAGKFDLIKASEDLYEMLTGVVKKKANEQNFDMPDSQSPFKSDKNLAKKSSGEETGLEKAFEDSEKLTKAQMRAENNGNYEHTNVKYKLREIEDNERIDLFQKISHRYLKVFVQGRLDEK